MRSTQQLSLTLPTDMPKPARDRGVETWLHTQVGPAYAALKSNPSQTLTAQNLRASLAAERAAPAQPK